jgi:flagellar operon protein
VVDKLLPGQPVQPTGPAGQRTPAQRQSGAVHPDVDFRQLLDDSLRTAGGIKFSAHAVRRLESRSIHLGPSDVSAIENAVDRAAAKGSRDSLVLSQSYAMVVNIRHEMERKGRTCRDANSSQAGSPRTHQPTAVGRSSMTRDA